MRDLDKLPFHLPADRSDPHVELLEYDARNLADTLKSELPPGVGFTLFLYDYGGKGRPSYISTGEREAMLEMIGKWLMSEWHKQETKAGRPSPFDTPPRPSKAKKKTRGKYR